MKIEIPIGKWAVWQMVSTAQAVKDAPRNVDALISAFLCADKLKTLGTFVEFVRYDWVVSRPKDPEACAEYMKAVRSLQWTYQKLLETPGMALEPNLPRITQPSWGGIHASLWTEDGEMPKTDGTVLPSPAPLPVPELDCPAVATKIAAFLESSKKTQREAGAMVGLDGSTISKFVKDRKLSAAPHRSTVVRLCALGHIASGNEDRATELMAQYGVSAQARVSIAPREDTGASKITASTGEAQSHAAKVTVESALALVQSALGNITSSIGANEFDDIPSEGQLVQLAIDSLKGEEARLKLLIRATAHDNKWQPLLASAKAAISSAADFR